MEEKIKTRQKGETLAVKCLIAEVKKGCTIGLAIREAICLAAEYWCNVEFVFNDTRYDVRVNDLVAQVRAMEQDKADGCLQEP